MSATARKKKRPLARGTRKRFEGRVKVWLRETMADCGIHRAHYRVTFENGGGRLVLRTVDSVEMIRKYGPKTIRAFGTAMEKTLQSVAERFHPAGMINVWPADIKNNLIESRVRLGNDWKGAATNFQLMRKSAGK